MNSRLMKELLNETIIFIFLTFQTCSWNTFIATTSANMYTQVFSSSKNKNS